MVKKMLFLVLAVTLLAFVSTSFASNVSTKAPMKKYSVSRGDEEIQNVKYIPALPGLITQSPGDTVGWTQWDYQTNGSTGNRVALDNSGAIHFAWMYGDFGGNTTRQIYYNFLGSDGTWGWPGAGTQVSYRNRDGYNQLAATNDGKGAVAYHNAAVAPNADSLFLAVDTFQGLGIFDYFHPLIRWGSEHAIWPYLTVDQQGYIHMTACETTPTAGDTQTAGYTRSTDGGATWTAAQRFDTVITISPIITSSPVSNKVAIVYTHPSDTTDQWHNDAYYILSNDGTTWDFANGKVNVTGYGAGGDSLWAYTDIDGVFDYNDNLHLLWNAQYISAEGGIYYNSQLFHYSTGTGNITQVYQFDTTFYSTGCEFGAWNFSIAKMSIGVDQTSNLFATYTSWDTTDCSSSGYANGDIYLNYSSDGGATWSAKTNLTNSSTPACAPGDCDSDHWSSLAEHVNDNLHLFYTNDKDAGGIPQSEGIATDNPMLYLAYPNPLVAGPGCDYVIGDINGNNVANGIDVVYAVGFFKGGPPPPDVCDCPGHGQIFAAGDVNGNCVFNGIDVTYFVGYLKGGPALRACADCPPNP